MIPRKQTQSSAPKTAAPVAKQAAPVPAAKADTASTFVRTPGKQPDFILKYKQGKEGQYTRVVGLYAQEGRNGGDSYYKGYDKGEEITWVVMPNTYVKKEE